jgi:hypothetical protein
LAKKELAVASRQRAVLHFLFQQEISNQTQHDCRPPPISISCVSSIEDKLKGRHLNTTEVIEAESSPVLNTLTEHGFQDAFKKRQRH